MKNFFERYHDIGEPLLRIGFAITLFWSITIKFTSTEKIVGIFNKVGLTIFGTPGGVYFVATLLLLAAIMLVLGFYTRIAAGFLTIFFLTTIISTFGTPVFEMVKVWKDFALLGISLFFLFHGSDYYSLDSRRKKKK